jgi:hypothetical protein
MAVSILQHLPRLLPEIEVYPLPEVIFLSTINALVVPIASLSSFQWYTIGSLVLLTNSSSELRKVTAMLYGYLSFIIGAEIALINVYVLVRILFISIRTRSSFPQRFAHGSPRRRHCIR